MKTRLLTSLYLVLAIVLAFLSRFFTLYVFDVIIGMLAVVGTVEVARVLERSKKYNSIKLVGLYPTLMYFGLIFAITLELAWQYYLLLFIAIFVLFFAISFASTMFATKTTQKEIKKYKITQTKQNYAFAKALNNSFLFLYPTLLFGSLMLLNHLGELSFVADTLNTNAGTFATFFLLLAVVVTVVTDSMAMITGMLIGGPKLAPIISPKKTISGAVGGVVFGTASAYLLYLVLNTMAVFSNALNILPGVWVIVVIGVVTSVLCQVGDIFASYLKRRARVKDYGTILPGHGGVMDRFDGLIFGATAVLVALLLLI